jgi:hypothetical protein
MEHQFRFTEGYRPPSAAFPTGQHCKRPYLTVSLGLDQEGAQVTVPFQAVVDTGAEYCAFSKSLVDELGLNWDSMPLSDVQGPSIDSEMRFANVWIEVPELGRWELLAGFCASVTAETNMLGYLGFLDRFTAAFDYQNGVFALVSDSNLIAKPENHT